MGPFIYHTYLYSYVTHKNTSRTATLPYDNEMPHSHGALYISYISIFICHTYKPTSRTAYENEMPHSHGAIYISQICIFYIAHIYTRHELLMIMKCLIHMGPLMYHTYLYSYVTHINIRHELLMIMRCLIHMGPFIYHTYVYSMSHIQKYVTNCYPFTWSCDVSFKRGHLYITHIYIHMSQI